MNFNLSLFAFIILFLTDLYHFWLIVKVLPTELNLDLIAIFLQFCYTFGFCDHKITDRQRSTNSQKKYSKSINFEN